MDNFDLKKYLTEGKLFEEANPIWVIDAFEDSADIEQAGPAYKEAVIDIIKSKHSDISDKDLEASIEVMNVTWYNEARSNAKGSEPEEMKVSAEDFADGAIEHYEDVIVFDNNNRDSNIDEGKLYENEYFDAYHEAGDKLENHPNYNKLVSILKDKGFEPDGTPYSDGTGRRDVHGVWDVFKSYTTEPGARGTTLTKANAKDINDALRQAGIEDIEATPSNSYSFRLKVNNLDEGRMKDPSGSIKMGKYPQVSSDIPVPMNVKYLTTNGEKLTMKVQAKNRKEAVDAVKSKDSNFKAEIKTDFVYDKDGNKLLKEDVSPKFKADDFVQPIEGVTYYSLDKPRGTISSKYVGQILDVYVNKPENIEMKDGEYIYAVDKLNHKGRNAMSFDFKESDLESISDPTDYIRSLTPYKRRN